MGNVQFNLMGNVQCAPDSPCVPPCCKRDEDRLVAYTPGKEEKVAESYDPYLEGPDPKRPSWLPSSGRGNRNTLPQRWALTIQQWTQFVDECMASEVWEGIVEKRGYVSSYDVCRRFVRPWTRGTGSSVALLMNSRRQIEAKVMISHAWGGNMAQTREAILSWSRANDLPSDLPVWFCLFSIYQPGDEAYDGGPTLHEQHEMDPVRQVLTTVRNYCGVAVVHTETADPYSRLWCLFELGEALSLGANTFGIVAGDPMEIREDTSLEVDAEKAVCGTRAEAQMLFKKIDEKGDKPQAEDKCDGSAEDKGTPETEIKEKVAEKDQPEEHRPRTMKPAFTKTVSFAVELVHKRPMDILNEKVGRSRLAVALSFAVNAGELEACTRLLDEGANPNARDIRGRTCLHRAAAAGNHELVSLLVERGGDCSLLDDEGNCPANLIPLSTASDMTGRLLLSLVPTSEIAVQQNAFCLAPFLRFKNWARSALGSKPFAAALETVRQMEERWPTLAFEDATTPARRTLTPKSSLAPESFHHAPVKGRRVRIYTKKTQGEVRGNVVLLSFCHPWHITKDALQPVTKLLCMACQVNLHILSSYASVRGEENRSLEDFLHEVHEVVESLKLSKPLFFIDDSEGLTASLAWKLKSKLDGMVFINPSHFYSEDFVGTERHAGEVQSIDEALKWVAKRNSEALVNSLGDIVYTEREKDFKGIQAKMLEVVDRVEPEWWNLTSCNLKWCKSTKAKLYHGLQPIRSVPSLIVCGAQAPCLSVTESSLRLRRRLLPGAQLIFLPHSKIWWKLEGMRQADNMANNIAEFIQHVQHNIQVKTNRNL